jgi:hypothetical protein
MNRIQLLAISLVLWTSPALAQKPPSQPVPRINDVYSDIADVVNSSAAFTEPVNFMSLPGYVRFRYFDVTGKWLSRNECITMLCAGSGLDDTMRRLKEISKEKVVNLKSR